MNNEIFELCLEINNLLLENETIKEYLRLKKIIEDDLEINKLYKKMKYYQDCHSENDDLFEAQKQYKEIIENPIISNFLLLQKEVEEIINEVKKQLL